MNSLYFLLRASAQKLAVVLTVMGLVLDGAIKSLQARALTQPVSGVRESKRMDESTNPLQEASTVYIFEDTGQPKSGDRDGGASRGCLESELPQVPLIALMPKTNLTLTLSERPTFWFYIPYTTAQYDRATFDLFDAENNFVIDSLLTIEFSNSPGESSSIPGIISVTLPPTAQPLELDREYHWYFSVESGKCKTSPSSSLPVHGWVKRVSPGSLPDSQTVEGTVSGLVTPDELAQLHEQLEQAQTPSERFLAYANHHIWLDALTEIARDRQDFPVANPLWPDRDRDWYNLLRSVNCEPLSDIDVSCAATDRGDSPAETSQ